MADSVKKFIMQRGVVKRQLTTFKTFLMNVNEENLPQLRFRLEKIEPLYQQFESIQLEIESLLEDEPECLEREIGERDSFCNEYFGSIASAKARLKESTNPSNNTQVNEMRLSNITTSCSNDSLVKLPALSLPEFYGQYNEYVQFKDTFDSLINNNVTLTNIQKFYYLKSALKGEAADVLKNLTISDSNYDTALKLLKARYDNKRVIINSHIQSLMDLKQINRESATSLRQLYDSFVKNVRSLENLELPVESWGMILIYIATSKLDMGTKRAWESSLTSSQLPTLTQFMEFMTTRCQFLESISTADKCQNIAMSKGTRALLISNSVTNNPICNHCKEQHYIYHCEKFRTMTPDKRLAAAKKAQLCTNCLRGNHTTQNCQSSGCRKCKRRHNTLLHVDRCDSKSTVNASNKESETDRVSVNNHCSRADRQSVVLLSTARIGIVNSSNEWIECRALLDSGSQSNFISQNLFNQLNLDYEQINLPIIGINGSKTTISKIVTTKIKSNFNNFNGKLSFLVIPKITGKLPTCNISKQHLSIPNNLKLADPNFDKPQDIDVLLGASIFYELLCIGQIKLGKGQPMMQKTRLGWILSGALTHYSPTYINTSSIALNCCQEMNDELKRFWEIEGIATNKTLTREEEFCENHFVRTLRRDTDGKFIVSLPLRDNYVKLGNSKELAVKQFMNIERKLQSNLDMYKQYKQFMNEYRELGHMTKVEESDDNSQVEYYMPHHGVHRKDSLTTSLRVVFNASAKTGSGLSLNDVMCVGPVVQNDLSTISINFRLYKIAFTADVSKMYRQVKIQKEQRDLQRIIWRDSFNEPLSTYRLNTVTYGTASASFLATRALRESVRSYKDIFPAASKMILSNFYVDDLLACVDNINEAKQLKQDITYILEKSGFQLRKWLSNDPSMFDNKLYASPIEHYYLPDSSTTKTLGVIWNSITDCFEYKIDLDSLPNKITKRTILSFTSRLFDPLGLLSPIIINAKVITQLLWREKLDWDESISAEAYTKWQQFANGLRFLKTVQIPRHVLLINSIHIELHGYCDASEMAYGACLYLKSIDKDENVKTQLLCSKSRVAPLKTVTIPRLELCGALLLAQLQAKILEHLGTKPAQTFLWTDSKIVLSWINSDSSRWKIFIANRVSEIQTLTEHCVWGHVGTQNNPADLISRGITPERLSESSLWWKGPSEFNQSTGAVEDDHHHFLLEQEMSRQGKVNALSLNDEPLNLVNRFSSLTKLRNVTGYILRFYHNCKKKPDQRYIGQLTLKELNCGMSQLIKMEQSNHFQSEITALMAYKSLASKSKLLSLHPFLDITGLLRVGGRLKNSKLNIDQKHPFILPPDSTLSALIIKHEHEKYFHAGYQTVLNGTRQKYWIINGKQAVRKILRRCVICARNKPKMLNPLMGDLPSARVTPSRPFASCGIDLAGPFQVKDGKTKSRAYLKGYMCLFVCLSTKAVHIELVGDLTTETLLNALKRFFSRRGLSKEMFSDNGTNLVGASNELKRIYANFYKVINDERLQAYILENQISWHFIPPRSPHFGGIWESAIKVAKTHLIKILGNTKLDYEHFSTVLTQIEAIMNSRPLTPLSDHPQDLNPLTPAHFLIGGDAFIVPDVVDLKFPTNRLTKYKLLTSLVQQFWSRWTKEYLHGLQQRYKWKNICKNVEPGQLVVIIENNSPPYQWPLGRVEEVHPGSDGVVRVVSVRVRNGIIKRAVNKVCMLPVNDKD